MGGTGDDPAADVAAVENAPQVGAAVLHREHAPPGPDDEHVDRRFRQAGNEAPAPVEFRFRTDLDRRLAPGAGDRPAPRGPAARPARLAAEPSPDRRHCIQTHNALLADAAAIQSSRPPLANTRYFRT
jgi:hypothetical protein